MFDARIKPLVAIAATDAGRHRLTVLYAYSQPEEAQCLREHLAQHGFAPCGLERLEEGEYLGLEFPFTVRSSRLVGLLQFLNVPLLVTAKLSADQADCTATLQGKNLEDEPVLFTDVPELPQILHVQVLVNRLIITPAPPYSPYEAAVALALRISPQPVG